MSSDLISRQAAVERFDYIRPRDPMTNDYTHGIDVGIALCKVAIREQPPAQLGTNLAEVGTDCISRQAAIIQLSHNKNKGDDEWELAVENDIQTIWKLPSAQHEKRTEERTETHVCDCISRRAAIRWVKTECNPYGKPTLEFESGKRVIEHLENMPPAQPEPSQVAKDISRIIENEKDMRVIEQTEIGYDACSNALLKMWMDNVLTDGEYNRIADKLNKKWGR